MTDSMAEELRMPQLAACVELLRLSGANEVQIRFQDDEEPTLWLVTASFPQTKDGVEGKLWDCGGGMSPLMAALRLCAEVIDGGQCIHCGKPAGFPLPGEEATARSIICWRTYDEKQQKYVRDCA